MLLSLQSARVYRELKRCPFPFPSQLGPDGFWSSLQSSQIPALISIRALSAAVQAGLKNRRLVPTLELIHLFPELGRSWLGRRENGAIFQNKYGLFVFVFASMLNSDCIRHPDTTIIINFPRLLSESCCHRDAMMDNVRCGNWMCWGKGKEGKADVSL